MKIKASQIKPGMLILRAPFKFRGKMRHHDYELVTAKKGFVKVKYTHFNRPDGFSGRVIGWMDGKEQIKVITNKKKKAKIVKEILSDVFKHLHDIKDDADLLRLIQAMES
jgi:hypothetical protein